MKITKYISLFALLCCGLIFTRATAVHVYTHDDGKDVENCIVCDVLLDAQNNELHVPNEVTWTPKEFLVQYPKVVISRTFFLRTTPLPSSILSRPPPYIA